MVASTVDSLPQSTSKMARLYSTNLKKCRKEMLARGCLTIKFSPPSKQFRHPCSRKIIPLHQLQIIVKYLTGRCYWPLSLFGTMSFWTYPVGLPQKQLSVSLSKTRICNSFVQLRIWFSYNSSCLAAATSKNMRWPSEATGWLDLVWAKHEKGGSCSSGLPSRQHSCIVLGTGVGKLS